MSAAMSADARRALRLLTGGAVGGVALAVASVVVCGLVGGAGVIASACVAAGVVLVVFALGQAVQVAVANLSAVTVMLTSLLSYVVRIGGFGLFLVVVGTGAYSWVPLKWVVVVAAVSTAMGWIAAEIWTYSRMRIPVFDTSEPHQRD